jgi:predicted nucleotidyltransferase
MRPSISLENNRSQVREVLQRFGMTNPRVFGSAARGEDTDKSDLDILVDAPPRTSLYDLAAVELELETILGCKVEVLTQGLPGIRRRGAGRGRPLADPMSKRSVVEWLDDIIAWGERLEGHLAGMSESHPIFRP